jgi:hypothetical protein
MLNLYKLEQFQVKTTEGKTTLWTPTSTNIVTFSENIIRVHPRTHDRSRRDFKYIFSYYDLAKFALNNGSYIPSFAALLILFNDTKK